LPNTVKEANPNDTHMHNASIKTQQMIKADRSPVAGSGTLDWKNGAYPPAKPVVPKSFSYAKKKYPPLV